MFFLFFFLLNFFLIVIQIVVVFVFIEVCFEDKNEFFKFVFVIKEGYFEKNEDVCKKWGGGIMGYKVQQCIVKCEKVFVNVIKV